MVTSMEKPMLQATAIPAASTPAAPLTPHNHGVSRASSRVMSRMPVGKPKPISRPAGNMTATLASARHSSVAVASEDCRRAGSHSGSSNR